MKYLARYARNADGTPTGLLVALRNDESAVQFGWSSCDEQDVFSKKVAKHIAIERALKGRHKPVASSVSSVITDTDFIQRCEFYFKEKIIVPAHFIMEENSWANAPKKVLVQEQYPRNA